MSGELSDVADALAAGDLGHAVRGSYAGVFGRLKDSCNAMSVRLGGFSTQLADSAAAVKGAAAEIASGSTDLARRTESQAAALEETAATRSEEHTSELQSLMRISYAVFCLQKKKTSKLHNRSRK